jgi:hypothetical protein
MLAFSERDNTRKPRLRPRRFGPDATSLTLSQPSFRQTVFGKAPRDFE